VEARKDDLATITGVLHKNLECPRVIEPHSCIRVEEVIALIEKEQETATLGA
jgi:hypothetical protein